MTEKVVKMIYYQTDLIVDLENLLWHSLSLSLYFGGGISLLVSLSYTLLLIIVLTFQYLQFC